jgi:hypothetical protein
MSIKPRRPVAKRSRKIAENAQVPEAAPPPAPPVDIAQEIYNKLKANPVVFFHMFFGEHTRKNTPPFHLQLMEKSITERHLAVAAPRGSAKSTILMFLKPIHAIMFKQKRFIVIVQNTFKKSAMSLDTIKKEIRENQKLRTHFQGVEISKDAEGDSVVRHPDGFETKILCKGVDQIGSIRGVKFGAWRPDLIIGDDMEDDELVRSSERRLQLQGDFDDALIPAGDKDACQFIFIGTVLHDDALIARLVGTDHYPEYTKLFYRARYEKHGEMRSLWPEQWSVEELNNLEKAKPTVFAKEYQNDPVAGQNVRFKREDFRYWREGEGRYTLLDQDGNMVGGGSIGDCRAAVACDLAWKEKRENDRSVILPGFLTPQNEILVGDYVAKRGMKPDEVGDHLFTIVDKLRRVTGSDVPVGFEKAMLENVTQYLLRQKMKRENVYITTTELVWDADKNTRIETRLQPRYAQHVIFHKRGQGDLESELERFPYGTHDDLPDALQGLVQLLRYPKQVRKGVDTSGDNPFNRMRQLTIEAKAHKPLRYPSKSRRPVVHANTSPL